MRFYIATLVILAPAAAQLSSVPKLLRGTDESGKAAAARTARRTTGIEDGISMSTPMSLEFDFLEAGDTESWSGGGKSEKSAKSAKATDPRRGLEATRQMIGLSMSAPMSLDFDYMEVSDVEVESWWGGGKSEKRSKTSKRRGLEATRRAIELEEGADGLSMSAPMSLEFDYMEVGNVEVESWWGGGKSEKRSKTSKRRGLEATRRAIELEEGADGLSMSAQMSLDFDYMEVNEEEESWWGGGKSEKRSKTSKRRGLEATRRAIELEDGADGLSMSAQMSLDFDYMKVNEEIESWWVGGKSDKSSKTSKRRGLEVTRRMTELDDDPEGLSMSAPMSLDVDFLESGGTESIESWWGGGKSEKSSKTAKRG